MANFFDQFDSGSTEISPSGRLRVVVTPPERSPYADAISKVESGGNYKAVGPDTGRGRALGRYQIMDSNVGPWSKEVLGREVTPQEFMASPEIQDQIFNAKFGTYVDKYGQEGAAKAWFAGERGMSDPNRRDALGTTVADYGRKFLGALGPSQANAAPASSPMAPAATRGATAGATSNFFDQFDAQPAPAPAQSQTIKPPPAVSAGESFASGVAQGATFNFYDELRGLMEAGGLNPKDPASLSALLQGAYKYFTGDQQAEQRYNQGSARERATAQTAAEANPVASIAGNVVGGVALPVGAAGQAATLPGRMGAGLATGAVMGAGYGAGSGVGAEDRASRALSGGLIGGAVGAVAPAVIEGATRGVKAVAAPVVNTMRGVSNPEAEASRRVMDALRRDAATGGQGLSPSQMVAARSQGAPVANMDMGGEVTRALGRSAANTSPEARAVLEKTISDRFEGQAGRVVDEIRALVATPAKAGMTREALQAAAASSRAPFYEAAYKAGSGGIWDAELQTLAQSPVMQKAIKDATVSIQNKAAAGRTVSPLSKTGTPTLEFWDQVKRSLDGSYNVAKRVGDTEVSADIQAIKSALVSKLDNAVPLYATARGVAAQLFKADDALEAGEKFVTSTLKNAEVAKAVSKMTPEERTLFSEGFSSKMIEKISEAGDRRNVIAQINKSPAAKERMAIALGPNAVTKMDTFLARENIMDRWRNAIQGNSTTVRQLVEAGLAGGAYGAYSGKWDMTTIMVGALTFGARRGQMKIDQSVAKRVGEMLASNDPTVLSKGLAIVAKSGTLSRALVLAEDAVTKIGSQQAPKAEILPAMQIPGFGRAETENNQPAVPRPPGQ